MAIFESYVGIDYSGAKTPSAGLPGLRIYEAGPDEEPWEVPPPSTRRRHWTREGVAAWLEDRIRGGPPALIGIDHGFSFPLRYFEAHGLPLDWPAFLDDFQRHWPTDGPITVDDVRRGRVGDGGSRSGNSRWRRLTEVRAGGAKSVFHFDVPGSVAKSTHAGLPWLLNLRRRAKGRVHVWPFDGWEAAPGRSMLAEVYPRRWSDEYRRGDRTPDQHDAYSVAAGLRDADRRGTLGSLLDPGLTPEERRTAEVEGWILGLL
ncbi:MAG: hypothetical protein AAGD06_31795 [Acidobacteriota bacterium]